MTEKIISRLLVFTAVCALFFALCAYVFRSESPGGTKQGESDLAICEYIEIDVLKTNVEIIPYDGTRIEYSYKNDVPITFEHGDNRLTITESDKFVISFLAGDVAEFGLTVYLPRDVVYREINVYTSSADVKIGGLDVQKINVVTGSGDIVSENTRSLAYLSTTNGDITLDCAAVIPESLILTRSGNARLLLPRGGSVALDYETLDGEISTTMFATSYGSNMYSINGGANLIYASLETGTLTVEERKK